MTTAILVVCGAPLTRRAGDLGDALTEDGWDVHIVGTPSSAEWIDPDTAKRFRPRFDFRAASEPKRTPAPHVVAVCPATFNTVNKAAVGIADNYALSVVCEAIGEGLPVLMAPMVNHKLWGHVQWPA